MLISFLMMLMSGFAQAQSTATLRGIDVYRSMVLSPETARSLYGARLQEIVHLRNIRQPVPQQKAEKLRLDLEQQAGKLPGIAYAQLSLSDFFTSTDRAVYATFDIVDKSDRERLNFKPKPQRKIPDPGGLLMAWKQYFDLGSAMAKRGEMSADRPECPGFYCLWGAPTPEMDDLQKRFVTGAATRENDLLKVLREEADDERRAAALFVLSYGMRGDKVVEYCQESLKDPAAAVRGAALQILADIVSHNKKFNVNAGPILPLLDDPSSSVRGKTLGLMVPMIDEPDARRAILRAAPRIVDLLVLRHPGNQDLAYTVLMLLSRKSYDRRDDKSWRAWAKKAAAGMAD